MARLNELRLVAAERRADLLLIADLVEEAVATLQALLAEHPEREQARGLFMQALYRAGRHTEALSTFRSWRRYLAEGLGLDPSPALRRIEQDILRHTAAAPNARGEVVNRTRALPVTVTSFVGRDADLAAVTGLLGQARLVTCPRSHPADRSRRSPRSPSSAANWQPPWTYTPGRTTCP